MQFGVEQISDEELSAALAVTHIDYLFSPSLSLDKPNICRDIILCYLMDGEVPILGLGCRIFDMLERVRCSSRVCNPNVIALVN